MVRMSTIVYNCSNSLKQQNQKHFYIIAIVLRIVLRIESLVAQLVRADLGGHGFDSRRGLRIFFCPMVVSLLKNPSSLYYYCY